jgi:hypothetical protein
MHGRKKKVQSDVESRLCNATFASPCASRTTRHAGGRSKRTIEDFLDVSSRDEVDAKVVWFLYACGIPSNVLCPPFRHDMVQARIVLLDKEREKIQRASSQFSDEWLDSGVSIVSNAKRLNKC